MGRPPWRLAGTQEVVFMEPSVLSEEPVHHRTPPSAHRPRREPNPQWWSVGSAAGVDGACATAQMLTSARRAGLWMASTRAIREKPRGPRIARGRGAPRSLPARRPWPAPAARIACPGSSSATHSVAPPPPLLSAPNRHQPPGTARATVATSGWRHERALPDSRQGSVGRRLGGDSSTACLAHVMNVVRQRTP